MDYYDFHKKYHFIDQHKVKPVSFAKIEEGRSRRAENQTKDRKSKRLDDFIRNRVISSPDVVDGQRNAAKLNKELKVEQRRQQLKQWKEEKLKKQQAHKNKPKPFTVGIVRHGLGPFEAPSPIKKSKNNILPNVRNTRLGVKNAQNKAVPNGNSVGESEDDKIIKKVEKKMLKEKSFAPSNAKFNPPINITKNSFVFGGNTGVLTRSKYTFTGQSKAVTNVKVPLKTQKVNQKPVPSKVTKMRVMEVPKKKFETKKAEPIMKAKENILKMNSPVPHNTSLEISITSMLRRKTSTPEIKKPTTIDEHSVSEFHEPTNTPENKSASCSGNSSNLFLVSPYVTVARGKGNMDREKISKLKFGYVSDNSPDEHAVIRFRILLDGEIERLTSLCDLWSKYQDDNFGNLPEHAKELIFQAIGQTKLLITKKFEQFRGLINRCESHEFVDGGGSVTGQDLEGFWDMIFMQVDDIDSRFKRLSDNRDKGWPDENEALAKVKTKPLKLKMKNAFVKKTASKGLRAMIQASRLKNNKTDVEDKSVNDLSIPVNQAGVKSFEAGFFSVVSPMKVFNEKSVVSGRKGAASPFLKEVLSSETKKKFTPRKSTPSYAAVMRASLTAKCVLNMDMDLQPVDATIPFVPINLNATPGKSILKRRSKRRKHANKSGKNVGFSNSIDDLDMNKSLESDSTDTNTTYDLLIPEPVKETIKNAKSEQNTEVYDAERTRNGRRDMHAKEDKENVISPRKSKRARRGRNSVSNDCDVGETMDRKAKHVQITGDTPKRTPRSRKSIQRKEVSPEISGKSDDLPSISRLSLNTPVRDRPRNTRKQLAVPDENILMGTPNTPVRRSARLSLRN